MGVEYNKTVVMAPCRLLTSFCVNPLMSVNTVVFFFFFFFFDEVFQCCGMIILKF